MAAIWEQHKPAMLARVDVLEAALHDSDPDLRSQARTAAHQLAGSVGTFGYARASELAREVETLLRENAAELAGAAGLVADLRAELETPGFVAATAEPEPIARTGDPLVLFVTNDNAVAQTLRAEAARRGLRAAAAAPRELDQALRRESPWVVVAGDDVGLRIASEFPVVILGSVDGQRARLDAARRGAAAFLAPGATPSEILDAASFALAPVVTGQERIALVGQAGGLSAFDVVSIDADDVLRGLEDAAPDGLVIAHQAAPDLCALLRVDPRWAALPIVVVGSEPVPGADEVVPADGDVAAALRVRLERSRAQASLPNVDPVSGAASRRASATAMGHLLRLAERHGLPMCVVALEPEDPSGAGRLGIMMRRALRGEDVVGRWENGRYVVGMLGITRDLTVDRIEGLRAQFDGSFNAGVAQFPAEGTDLQTLHAAAVEALGAARAETPVMAAGRGPGVVKQVDVAIVEDEDATAELISNVLGKRGYTTWRFSNGAGAVAMLAGERPQVLAGVILLDLNLPAVDGVELLTLLAHDGVLKTSRLVVVSGNADPEVQARTRALGAEDYIVKPVDLERLTMRVDELLGRRR